MLKWTRRKYQNPELRKMLLDTDNQTLTEFNYWHDTFFGICDGTCRTPHKEFIGENKLGKIIMQVREEIRCEK